MGFLDRLAGRPAQKPDDDAAASASAAATAQQQQQAGRSTSEVLHDISPGTGPGPGFGGGGARLYDPYEGISAAVGGRHAAFTLPEGPEFVFQEEAAARRRGWGENLQFYTGLGYLGGERVRARARRTKCLVSVLLAPPHPPAPHPRAHPGGATGFAIGGYRYLLQPPQEPALGSLKLKANRLINMSGSLGRRFACAAAITGLYFASFEALAYGVVDGRLPDGVCTAGAGARVCVGSGGGRGGPLRGRSRARLCRQRGSALPAMSAARRRQDPLAPQTHVRQAS